MIFKKKLSIHIFYIFLSCIQYSIWICTIAHCTLVQYTVYNISLKVLLNFMQNMSVSSKLFCKKLSSHFSKFPRFTSFSKKIQNILCCQPYYSTLCCSKSINDTISKFSAVYSYLIRILYYSLVQA